DFQGWIIVMGNVTAFDVTGTLRGLLYVMNALTSSGTSPVHGLVVVQSLAAADRSQTGLPVSFDCAGANGAGTIPTGWFLTGGSHLLLLGRPGRPEPGARGRAGGPPGGARGPRPRRQAARAVARRLGRLHGDRIRRPGPRPDGLPREPGHRPRLHARPGIRCRPEEPRDLAQPRISGATPDARRGA